MINNIKALFSKPTPRMMLARQLDEAERQKITYQAHTEYTSAMVLMLDARIARIKQNIQAMNNQEQQ